MDQKWANEFITVFKVLVIAVIVLSIAVIFLLTK